MPRGFSLADLDGGQQLFKPTAYARLVGEHPNTTWNKIGKGEIPTVDTPDGRRITRETVLRRLGQIPAPDETGSRQRHDSPKARGTDALKPLRAPGGDANDT
jgi:hypothetical protein